MIFNNGKDVDLNLRLLNGKKDPFLVPLISSLRQLAREGGLIGGVGGRVTSFNNDLFQGDTKTMQPQDSQL